MELLIALSPALPLAGFLAILVFGRRLGDVHQQRSTARWDTVFRHGRASCCARPRVFQHAGATDCDGY